MALGLPNRSKSASVFLQFLTAPNPEQDPTFAACLGPIGYWARNAFAGSAELWADMQTAWQKQAPRLGLAGTPWQRVAGPAGAVSMVLKRLRWAASSAFRWMLRDGTTVDIRHLAPHAVAKLAAAAARRPQHPPRRWCRTTVRGPNHWGRHTLGACRRDQPALHVLVPSPHNGGARNGTPL